MNTVLLGGNGYIGRAATEYWLNKDKDMHFYVLSRSGKNQLSDSRITNIAVDVTNKDAVMKILPDSIDFVVDFVGGLNSDEKEAEKMNIAPAKTMLAITGKYDVKAMGYVGGILGSKSFTAMKKKVIALLQKDSTRLAVVEPTLVYGNGRNDSLAKMVPLLKFFGVFSKKMKPVLVTDVAKELVDKLTEVGK